MVEIEELLDKAMFDIANRLRNELVLKCPVDKGFLKNSIKVKPLDNKKGLLIWMADYGKFVEFGTPPHIINPKNKKALKFKGKDGVVIVKKVKHPGTRPNPFIRTAIQTKLKNIIMEELIRAQG